MSTHTIPRLAPTARRQLQRVSAFDVAWDARWHRLEAITGHAGTGVFATAANLMGDDGATLAALEGQPRWQSIAAEDPTPAVPGGAGFFGWFTGYMPWLGGTDA